VVEAARQGYMPEVWETGCGKESEGHEDCTQGENWKPDEDKAQNHNYHTAGDPGACHLGTMGVESDPFASQV
jgi:hypothetical protein